MTALKQHDPMDERRLRISSLMDGELDDAAARQLLSDLSADPAARDDWSLWHAAGDALRASEVAAMHSTRFAARVSLALDDEPAIVAPLARAANPHRMVRRILLPGMAAAAAVAALSWVALPMLRGVDEVATQQADVAAVTAIASAPPPLPPSVAASRLLPVDAVQSVRFDRYMAAHGQMSGTLGLPRTSQYVLRDPATDAEGR
jgi:sigma-E factor negative regulatory protein RseA